MRCAIAHARRRRPEFREAQRVLAGWTAGVEKRALVWLAARTPAAVTSDHLTLLGLAAMAACGGLYAASAGTPWLLLARERRPRPQLARRQPRRHARAPPAAASGRASASTSTTSPTPSARCSSLGGLALSGWMSPLVAAAVLVAYFLLAIETYLATYAIGRFKISWGPSAARSCASCSPRSTCSCSCGRGSRSPGSVAGLRRRRRRGDRALVAWPSSRACAGRAPWRAWRAGQAGSGSVPATDAVDASGRANSRKPGGRAAV